MIWVSWRQHRSQAIACLGLLAALAVYAIVVGTSMSTAFGQDDGLVTCLARSQGNGCPDAIHAFTDRFGSEVNVAFWSVLLILPGLIGVLVGGPLIARELEFGTWRLAWSQTVSRARWLTVKLGLVTGGLIVLGAAMTAVITWYRARGCCCAGASRPWWPRSSRGWPSGSWSSSCSAPTSRRP